MDKDLARRNIRFGVAMFVMLLGLVGASLAWATLYNQVVT